MYLNRIVLVRQKEAGVGMKVAWKMWVVALGLPASGGWRHPRPDVSGTLKAGYSDGGL